MPLNLNNILNENSVSPRHSNSKQTEGRSKRRQEYEKISKIQPISINLRRAIYNERATNGGIPRQSYQKPVTITSYSYDNKRQIKCGKDQFDSVRPLIDDVPHTGFDLNHAIDQAVFQDQSIDESLDGLLISLLDFFNKTDPTRWRDDARGLLCTKLITWRGIMTKLCSSVYETAGSHQNTGWSMNVMMVNGTLYIEEGSKEDITKDLNGSRRPTYYGYCYENLMTNASFEPVNTNQQWVPVVKSNLNGIRLLLGGEVDAIDHHLFRQLAQNPSLFLLNNLLPDHFVEIKTSINPVSEREFSNFYRFKLLKFWLQSFLLGTPKIHVGLRDKEGIVCGTENYKTQEIPSLVRRYGKPSNRWSSNLCLENGTRIIQMILNKLKTDLHDNPNEKKVENDTVKQNDNNEGKESHEYKYSNRLKYFQDKLDTIISDEFEYQKKVIVGDGKEKRRGILLNEELSSDCKERINQLIDWPVYRLNFLPKQQNNHASSSSYQHQQHQHESGHLVELIELDPIEVQQSVLQFKSNSFFNYQFPPGFSTSSNHIPHHLDPNQDADQENSINNNNNMNNRIGFLPQFWLLLLVKIKVDLLFEQSFNSHS